MYGLLIHNYEYASDNVKKKLYHKIFASEYDGVEAARKLAEVEAVKLNNSSAQYGERVSKFVSVDGGYFIENVDEFDAAVIYVDGKDGIYSENDATIHPVVTYKVVQFVTDVYGGRELTR